MVILLHVLIALASLILTGITFLFPSKAKLFLSYTLVALTLVSGTYLVLTKPAHILQTCLEGLIYLAVVTVGIFSAQRKLATIKT